jgi:hypothetical protein
VAAGRDPWALPLKIGTHTLHGVLALRLVAALKGRRRHGSRFALEQTLDRTQWLAAVAAGAARDAALGLELAMCGRLIKGYGSTNERGKANLLHVLQHLAVSPALPDPAAVRAGHCRGPHRRAAGRGRHPVRRRPARARRSGARAARTTHPLDAQTAQHGAMKQPIPRHLSRAHPAAPFGCIVPRQPPGKPRKPAFFIKNHRGDTHANHI